MNLKDKKKKLVEEFNANRQRLAAIQQQMNLLATRQVRIEGQLQLIDEMGKEDKKDKKPNKK